MIDELPTGYYLENFNFLLNFVYEQYDDVLSSEEIAYRHDFQSLSLDAQMLYVRLTGRRGPLFRADKIVYEEIDSIAQAISELLAAKFFSDAVVDGVGVEAEAAQLLGLVTKSELQRLFPGIDKKWHRDELDEFLGSEYSTQQIRQRLRFQIIAPLGQQQLQIYKLLFFGNLHQDFTEFVLRDLGISPFESYVMDRSARYFDSREILQNSVQAYALAETCHLVLAEGEADDIIEFSNVHLPDEPATDRRLRRRFSKMYNSLARQLERYEKVEEALALYEYSHLSPARERSARLHAKNENVEVALDLCRQMHEKPENEEEFEFAIKFSARLSKRHKISCDWLPETQAEDFQIDEISVVNEADTKVEMLACYWFNETGADARYVENGLLPGLFGLYFWDVIFAPIKGVFFNPVQRGPADLFTPDFIRERQGLIKNQLQRMDERFFNQTVQSTFKKKFGIANHFVSWGWIDEDLINKSLQRIPVAHLKLIFERILRDLRANRSGLPDLIVFPENRGYQLTEIKGPGDRLQNNQKRWFKFFKANNIPANVVNVSWL